MEYDPDVKAWQHIYKPTTESILLWLRGGRNEQHSLKKYPSLARTLAKKARVEGKTIPEKIMEALDTAIFYRTRVQDVHQRKGWADEGHAFMLKTLLEIQAELDPARATVPEQQTMKTMPSPPTTPGNSSPSYSPKAPVWRRKSLEQIPTFIPLESLHNSQQQTWLPPSPPQSPTKIGFFQHHTTLRAQAPAWRPSSSPASNASSGSHPAWTANAWR